MRINKLMIAGIVLLSSCVVLARSVDVKVWRGETTSLILHGY